MRNALRVYPASPHSLRASDTETPAREVPLARGSAGAGFLWRGKTGVRLMGPLWGKIVPPCRRFTPHQRPPERCARSLRYSRFVSDRFPARRGVGGDSALPVAIALLVLGVSALVVGA